MQSIPPWSPARGPGRSLLSSASPICSVLSMLEERPSIPASRQHGRKALFPSCLHGSLPLRTRSHRCPVFPSLVTQELGLSALHPPSCLTSQTFGFTIVVFCSVSRHACVGPPRRQASYLASPAINLSVCRSRARSLQGSTAMTTLAKYIFTIVLAFDACVICLISRLCTCSRLQI